MEPPCDCEYKCFKCQKVSKFKRIKKKGRYAAPEEKCLSCKEISVPEYFPYMTCVHCGKTLSDSSRRRGQELRKKSTRLKKEVDKQKRVSEQL